MSLRDLHGTGWDKIDEIFVKWTIGEQTTIKSKVSLYYCDMSVRQILLVLQFVLSSCKLIRMSSEAVELMR